MKKYLIGAVLSLGIIASPALTHAAALSDSQVQAVLSLLSTFGADNATMSNVKTALMSGTTTTGGQAFCHTFRTDLTVGDSGPSVSALNQALLSSGVNMSGNTSSFDENTAANVVSFQARYGIRQTGYVGPLTRAKLNALYACATPTTGVTSTTGQTATTTPVVAAPTPSISSMTAPAGETATIYAGERAFIYGTNLKNIIVNIGGQSINALTYGLTSSGLTSLDFNVPSWLSAGVYDASVTNTYTGLTSGTYKVTVKTPTTSTATTGTTATAATPNSLLAVSTTPASNITATAANLNGTANPAGTIGTTGWFRISATKPGSCSDTFGTRSNGDTLFSQQYQFAPYVFIVTGLTPNTTYYYCAIAQNATGKGYGSIASFTTLSTGNTGSTSTGTTATGTGGTTTTPTATITQSTPSTISGMSYTLTWGSKNATSCSLWYTGPDGSVTIISSGPTSGGPKTFTTSSVGTYVAKNTCTGPGGTASATVTHTVTADTSPESLPTVSTNTATDVTKTSATLNGSIYSTGTTKTTGWFRISASNPGSCSDTFGMRVPSGGFAFSSDYLNKAFSESVAGLMSGTMYYYCAIAQNATGNNYGSIISFLSKYNN